MNLGKVRQALTAQEIFDLIHDDLVEVERKLSAECVASVDTVTAIGQYLHSAGGKRLRPALLILSARLASGDVPARPATAIHMGAVVELIHAATLVHDDVIDAAQTRRGRPSSNARWGNHTCVLAGDWLYMQAFQIALRERDFATLDLLIGLTQIMVEGELLQLDRIGRIDVSEPDCMELVDRKTARLFSVCARLGVAHRGRRHGPSGTPRRVRLEPRHGLPARGRRARFHRPREDPRQARGRRPPRRQGDAAPGLRPGARHPRRARAWSAPSSKTRSYDTVPFARILDLLEKYRAIERVRERAQAFTDKARMLINEFPDSPYQRALLAVTGLVTERDH